MATGGRDELLDVIPVIIKYSTIIRLRIESESYFVHNQIRDQLRKVSCQLLLFSLVCNLISILILYLQY